MCVATTFSYSAYEQQCVVIRGSTLVREDMPGSEMSGAEYGYNPSSTKGKTLHNEFIIISILKPFYYHTCSRLGQFLYRQEHI
jgi:hypothetical protein